MSPIGLKLLGVVLVIGAGSAVGFYKAHELKRRIADIIMLQNSFRLLETEIYYTRSPVPIAMELLETKLSETMKTFFYHVRYGMEYHHLPLCQAWEEALHDLEQRTCLCAEEVSAVHNFGLSLGVGDIQDQQKHFQLLQQRLQHALQTAEHNSIKQERIWQYMGVCVSMVVVLLLC